jgi:hypothetical protein
MEGSQHPSWGSDWDGSQAPRFEDELLALDIPVSTRTRSPEAAARRAWFEKQAIGADAIDMKALREAHEARVAEMRAQAAAMRPPRAQPVDAERKRKRTSMWCIPDATAAEMGNDLVGRRIKIWWSEDRTYFKGVVSAWRERRNRTMHQVTYDDGDVKWHELDVGESWRVKSAE